MTTGDLDHRPPTLPPTLPARRFTGPLAAKASSLVALDFMENLIEQNRRENGHHGNIDFRWVLGLEYAGLLGMLGCWACWLGCMLAHRSLQGLLHCTAHYLTCVLFCAAEETPQFRASASLRPSVYCTISGEPRPEQQPTACLLRRCGDAMELTLPNDSCDVAFRCAAGAGGADKRPLPGRNAAQRRLPAERRWEDCCPRRAAPCTLGCA